VGDGLASFERILADAMTRRDPVAEFARAAADTSLPDWMRRAFRAAHADGVRLSALLVAKLRFERLVQGSRCASEWFDRDARSFTAAFKRYHEHCPPRAVMASDEGRAFDAWCDANAPERPIA
jgi:hypothetical protein